MTAEQLRVGQMLYGFCGGSFGRDSYDDKRVEAIAADWVVCRCPDGFIAVYSGGPPEALLKYVYPICEDCQYQGPPRADGACARCASATGLIRV